MNATQHRRSSRSWIITGIILTLVIAVLLAFSVPWNLNALRGWISQKVHASSGRTLQLDGDLILYWGLFRSNGTHLTADRIRFSNPDWANKPDFIKAERIDAQIALLPLFSGRIFLPLVTVDQPEVQLEILADGRRNWAFDREQKNERDLPFQIGRLALNSGRLGYRAAYLKTDVEAMFNTGTSTDSGNRMNVTADGLWRGLTLNLSGHGGDVLGLRDTSAPYDFDLRATIGQSQVSAQGSVTGLLNPGAANLKLKLSGATMSEWYRIAGLGLPETPAYRTEGRLSLSQGIWRYDEFTGQIGNSQFSGSVTFEPRNARRPQRPFIRGKVHSQLLDLKDLGPLIGKNQADSTSIRDSAPNEPVRRVLPQRPFDSEKWGTLDADLSFEARQVRNLAALPFDNLSGRLTMQDKVLTFSPLRFGFANGDLSNELRLDGRTHPMQMRIDGQFRNLQLFQLLPRLEESTAALGNINGKILLNGQGNSIAAMLGTSTGSIQLAMGRGEISNLMLELLDLDAYEALGFLLRGDRSVQIRCGVADLEMKSGLMTPRVFVFDTTDTIVTTQGQINFANENLNLKVSPVPKDMSLLTLRVPFHIRGPFSKPDIGPDKGLLGLRAGGAILLGLINPLAALIPLIETGPGQDSRCSELLNHIRNVPARNITPGKPARGTSKIRKNEVSDQS